MHVLQRELVADGLTEPMESMPASATTGAPTPAMVTETVQVTDGASAVSPAGDREKLKRIMERVPELLRQLKDRENRLTKISQVIDDKDQSAEHKIRQITEIDKVSPKIVPGY